MPGPMTCPHCAVPLVMSERQGVEIDYCPQCRGVRLDRGELDKILERAGAEAPPPARRARRRRPPTRAMAAITTRATAATPQAPQVVARGDFRLRGQSRRRRKIRRRPSCGADGRCKDLQSPRGGWDGYCEARAENERSVKARPAVFGLAGAGALASVSGFL